MLGFNKVMLMGNATRDPELRQLSNGENSTSIAEFGLACNRRYRTASGEDREETLFIDCTIFGKQADTIARFVKKGKPLFVEGRLRYEAWDDNQGNKRSKVSVVVETFQFVGGRHDSGASAPAASGAAQANPGQSRNGWKQKPDRRRGGAAPVKVAQADIPF